MLTLHRAAEATRKANGDLIDASLASDAPYQRDGYAEILRCTPEAVNLERARDGLALLLHHDRSQIAGRVYQIRADGRRVRGRLQFFDTDAGREARAMVEAGHRELSVGYTIDQHTRSADGDQVVVTRWTLLEVSVVAIPADPHVGVNRSFNMPQTTHAPAADDQAADDQHLTRSQRRAAAHAADAEAERIATLNRLARGFGQWIQPSDLARAIDENWEPARLNDLIMRNMQSGATDVTMGPGPAFIWQRGDRLVEVARHYDVGAALRELAEGRQPQGLERELHAELARGLPVPTNGTLVPMSAFFAGAAKRDLYTGSSTGGGSFVQTTVMESEFIAALRQRSVVIGLGARTLMGLQGPTNLPKATAVTTATWLTEKEAASETAPTTGVVSLSPKRIGAYADVSKQLLISSAVDLQALVLDDLRTSILHEVDRVALEGTGASSQPTGIAATAGVGSVVGGTNGAALTWAHILELEADVDAAGGIVNPVTTGYAINPTTRGYLKRTLRVSGQPTGLIMGEAPMDTTGLQHLNGYRCAVSGKVPSNLTKGTSNGVCSRLFFGDFSQLIIASFGGAVELLVDPYTLARTAQVRIVANAFMDIGVRHPASFSVMSDALTA